MNFKKAHPDFGIEIKDFKINTQNYPVSSFESKKSFMGFALAGGIKIIDTPNNIEKNITCSMFLLSEAADTKFEGTRSTSG